RHRLQRRGQPARMRVVGGGLWEPNGRHREACRRRVRDSEIDRRRLPRRKRPGERVLSLREVEPHASGGAPSSALRGRGSRSRCFSTNRNADQISSMAMILLSVRPAARPTARTSCSSRSVKKPELLRGQATQRAPWGARTCFAFGNSSPSTAREEEKTTMMSARLTILVVTPTPSGSGSSRRTNPTGGSSTSTRRPSLMPSLWLRLVSSIPDPPCRYTRGGSARRSTQGGHEYTHGVSHTG